MDEKPRGKGKRTDGKVTQEIIPIHAGWHRCHVEHSELKVELATGKLHGVILIACDECPQRSLFSLQRVPEFHAVHREEPIDEEP